MAGRAQFHKDSPSRVLADTASIFCRLCVSQVYVERRRLFGVNTQLCKKVAGKERGGYIMGALEKRANIPNSAKKAFEVSS